MTLELQTAQTHSDAVVFTLDLGVYELDAVLRAAYRFIETYYVSFSTKTPGQVEAALRLKQAGAVDERRVSGEFQNELLHCMLRRSVQRETKVVREMILGRALFGALINLDEHGEPAPVGSALRITAGTRTGYADDPEGIAGDWFE